jgi:hypothetical protein
MVQVNVEALLSFAEGLVGQELRTLDKRRPFSIAAVDGTEGGLTFVTSEGNQQQASGRWLRETCDVFSRTNSYRPSDYRHTHGVNYTLALISRFASSQPSNT